MGPFTQIAIFDLDGTLVDSAEQIAVSLNKARSDFGYPTQPISYYQELVGLPVDELLADIEISKERSLNLVTHFRKYLVRDIQRGNNAVFPGVLETLKLFAGMHMGLAVATSKPIKVAIEVIKHSSLRDFDLYVQGTDDFPPKPDPEVILRVLRHFPKTPSFMVGDRAEDIWAAQRAALPAIGIASGGHSESDLKDAGATLTFDTFQNFFYHLKADVSLIPKLSQS
jgi:phosphoglycolate phosphatase